MVAGFTQKFIEVNAPFWKLRLPRPESLILISVACLTLCEIGADQSPKDYSTITAEERVRDKKGFYFCVDKYERIPGKFATTLWFYDHPD